MFFAITWLISFLIVATIAAQWTKKTDKNYYCEPVRIEEEEASVSTDAVKASSQPEQASLALAPQEPSESLPDGSDQVAVYQIPDQEGWKKLVWYFYPKTGQEWCYEHILGAAPILNAHKNVRGQLVVSAHDLQGPCFGEETLLVANLVNSGSFGNVDDRTVPGFALYSYYRTPEEGEILSIHFQQIARSVAPKLDPVILNELSEPILFFKEKSALTE